MTTVERQVRTLLRAWPIPDRIERGEEIVGTTLDLVPDGSSRVPFAQPHHGRPPGPDACQAPAMALVYYQLGGRLSARWHRWMVNDLNGPGWMRRLITFRLIFVSVAIAGSMFLASQFSQPGRPSLWPSLIGSSIGWLVCASLFFPLYRSLARKDRERQLARNGYGQMVQNYPPWPPPTQERLNASQSGTLPSPPKIS